MADIISPLRKRLRSNSAACLGGCNDDIVLSIASYLPLRNLLSLALTCRRFGVRGYRNGNDQLRRASSIDRPAVLPVGSRAFAIPNYMPEGGGWDQKWFMCMCTCKVVSVCKKRIWGSIESISYKVEFESPALRRNLGESTQWIHQSEIISREGMTERVEQNMKYLVSKSKGVIGYHTDTQTSIASTEFIQGVYDRKVVQLNQSLHQHRGKLWSLMDEAAKRMAFKYLLADVGEEDNCSLVWKKEESWMGICHKFEQELEALSNAEENFDPQYIALEEESQERHMNILNRIFEDNDLDFLVGFGNNYSQMIANEFDEPYNNSINYLPKLKQLTPVGCELNRIQIQGARRLISFFETGISGVLMDLGEGKRIEVSMLIAFLWSMQVTGPIIVVAPLSMVPTWVRVFKRWLPSFPIVSLDGTMEEREALYSGQLNPINKHVNSRRYWETNFPLIIAPYEIAVKDREQLSNIAGQSGLTCLIIDEGQGFKDHRCALVALGFSLRSKFRLFLPSGPLKSDLHELVTLLYLVHPAYAQTLRSFSNQCTAEEKQQIVTGSQAMLEAYLFTDGEN